MHFCLNDIEALVHIGITKDEQAEPQLLKLKVEFDFDTSQAEKSDDIDHTVDYQLIYDIIREFSKSGYWNLLEKMHNDLLSKLTQAFPEVGNLKLEITKSPWTDGSVTIY